jgi:hypothetical protein
MAKPIFIVKVPEYLKENFEDISESLSNKINDYHCITILSDVEDFEFRGLYEKYFDEVKYEELKQIVKDSCK